MKLKTVEVNGFIRKNIPFFQWISDYSRKTLGFDTISGITLAAYAIPVSLAYATLAGLPPQMGVYGYLLGGFFYALMGSSKQLAIGPTSAISLLIGSTLSTLAQGNVQHWIDLASLTAFIFSILSVLLYFLRMSSIINFISSNVLLGFKAGAALTIGLTQLPKLFGVAGGGSDFFTRLVILIKQLPETNFYVLLFGLLAIAIIGGGEKLLPNKPITIFVVIVSILIVSLTSISDFGIKAVGSIPQGLPKLHFPIFRYDDLLNVAPLAFACFLLAYIESVSTGRTLGQKNGYDIDARQEMLALGIANLASSLGNGYPVSGGLSQSAVNDGAGAKTPMSLIIASLTIAFCLLFLTGMLKNLPSVLLACIVLVAIKSLIDVKEFKHLWKINRQDFYIAMIALIGVIVFGILKGVIIAAIASILLIIKIVSSPNIAILGRIPGTTRYSDFQRHHHNEKLPHILIFRVEAPILYFNVNNIYNTVFEHIASYENDLKVVIMDLGASAYIDSSGAKFIKKLYYELDELDLILRLAEAHSEVRDMLRKEEAEELFGKISRRDSLHDVVTNCLLEHLEWQQELIKQQTNEKWHK